MPFFKYIEFAFTLFLFFTLALLFLVIFFAAKQNIAHWREVRDARKKSSSAPFPGDDTIADP